MRKSTAVRKSASQVAGYERVLAEVSGLLEAARHATARAVNAFMTATYWQIGQRIVESEMGGRRRAGYGDNLIDLLARDLTRRFGRGFGKSNLYQMRAFYMAYRDIFQTPSGKSAAGIGAAFPLPWSHYVRLLAVESIEARSFYEAEALRGGWSARTLDRQIQSLFYQRTALSRDKASMLRKGRRENPKGETTAEEQIKDPFLLEFLDLKDEYSELDMEEALIRHLETFLLELGGDFAFVGRQRRLRVGDEWYRIDLLFFHRRLRCLVVIDLKTGRLTPADAGQMHMYLNYAAAHWTNEGENPPVGIILCSEKDAAVARYALDNLPNKVLASEYRTKLPNEKALAGEIEKTRRLLEARPDKLNDA